MTDDMPQQSSIAELQLAVEELKKALRDTVFESGRQKSAILGAPRKDYKWPDLFVLMPFSAQLEPVYKDHIQVVAQRAELTVDWADNFFFQRSDNGRCMVRYQRRQGDCGRLYWAQPKCHV